MGRLDTRFYYKMTSSLMTTARFMCFAVGSQGLPRSCGMLLEYMSTFPTFVIYKETTFTEIYFSSKYDIVSHIHVH